MEITKANLQAYLLLLFSSLVFVGCDNVRFVDLDKQIIKFLDSSELLNTTLKENELDGYEYSSFRKGGLSIQAFLQKEGGENYLIVDLHREGGGDFRLRAIRHIMGKFGTPQYEQVMLYLEDESN